MRARRVVTFLSCSAQVPTYVSDSFNCSIDVPLELKLVPTVDATDQAIRPDHLGIREFSGVTDDGVCIGGLIFLNKKIDHDLGIYKII